MTDLSKIDEDGAALDLLIRGFQISRMIRLVADLEIADKVPLAGHVDVGELATTCAVQPLPLLRVLRALAAFGIFRVTAHGNVGHSALSLRLRTDAPKSLHYSARFWTALGSWNAWGLLDVALRGEIPHQVAWNASRFKYLSEHPDEGRVFDAFMARMPDDRHNAVASSYDFSAAAEIVDLGGGNGETLRRILARFPKPRGLVFDREDVVAAIPAEARLNGRIDVEHGSFFDRVPSGADVYLLIRVLHDWSDEDCVRILANCRAAMSSSASLLIVEQILNPDPASGHPSGYLLDIQMMAMFGTARERTQAEFGELLAASGLSLVNLIPTASAVSVLEVVPQRPQLEVAFGPT